jgi:hypothetical protein
LNATPTVPVADVALVITGAAGLIVNVNVALPVPVTFVALNVTVDVAAVSGVPEITPVAVLIDRPEGNPVALKLAGLLAAVIW